MVSGKIKVNWLIRRDAKKKKTKKKKKKKKKKKEKRPISP